MKLANLRKALCAASLFAVLFAYGCKKQEVSKENLKSIVKNAKVISASENSDFSISIKVMKHEFMLTNEEVNIVKYEREFPEEAGLAQIKFEDEKKIDDMMLFMGYRAQYSLTENFHLLRKGKSVVFASADYEEGIPLLNEIAGYFKRRGYKEKKIDRVEDYDELAKKIDQVYRSILGKEDTSEIINLTKSWIINEKNAVFSPDGKYIAFSGNTLHGVTVHPSPSYIYIMKSDGSEVHKLFESPGRYILPIWDRAIKPWSEDGTRLYVFKGSLERKIKYYDFKLKKLCDVTEEELGKLQKNSVSPNGKMEIYFPAYRSGIGTSLGVKHLDSGEKEILVEETPGKDYPKIPEEKNFPEIWMTNWSPDSKWIAYNFKEFGAESEIYIHALNVETKEIKILAKGMHPNWSPDGKYVAFCNYSLPSSDIFLYKWHLEK